MYANKPAIKSMGYKELLSEVEIQVLEKRIPEMVDYCIENGKDTIIGVDVSGRPVALMMRNNWKKRFGYSPKVHFISPEPLDYFDADFLLKDFERQQPWLYKKMKEMPEKLVYVDDQLWRGRTKKDLQDLSFAVCGERINYIFLTDRNKKPIPSWHSRKEHVGVWPVLNFVSDKSEFFKQENINSFREKIAEII